MFEPILRLLDVFEQSSFLVVIIFGLLVTSSSVVYYYKHIFQKRLKEQEGKCRTEAENLRSELYSLTQIMENLGEPCIYKNSSGVYSWCNHELELLWGMPRSRIINATVEELFPEPSDEMRKLEARFIASGKTLIKERKMSDKEGKVRNFEITLKKIPQGQSYGILIFYKDISYYREQLDILNDLYVSTREDLQKRSNYYADFLKSGLPPLNRIMQDSELLLNEKLDKKLIKDKIVDIVNSGYQVNSLIRNLSFLAFPDKTAALYLEEDALELLSLEDWQNKLVDRIRIFSEKTGFASFVLLQGDVPETMNTRFVLLNELLERLIENAEKFSKGGFYLLIKVNRVESAYFTMNISVRNNGPVIVAEERENIFKPFTKIIKKGDGPGLGLTVGRSLAEKMGGSLSCDPACEKGARFLLSLPPVKGEGTVISGNRLGGSTGRGGKTILLVHNENPLMQRMAVQLKRSGIAIKNIQFAELESEILSDEDLILAIVDDEAIVFDEEILSKEKIVLLSRLGTVLNPLDWSLLLDLLIDTSSLSLSTAEVSQTGQS